MSSGKKSYGIKNFLHIANAKVNPELNSAANIKTFLMSWFVLKHETTFQDERLLNMTLEELLVLYNMHKIHEDPGFYQQQTGTVSAEDAEYEAWLKEEMGDEYVTEKENIEQMEAHDKEYTEKVRKQFGELPDTVTTDFSQFEKKE